MRQETLIALPAYMAPFAGMACIRVSARKLKACDTMGRPLYSVPRKATDPVDGPALELASLIRARHEEQA